MVSLQSFNFADRFIRHASFLGELSPIVSGLDREDASFTLVPGLADGRMVSLLSYNLPGHYLRHENFRLLLAPLPTDGDPARRLFTEDATFAFGPGFADESAVSFRSVNFPDRFIRHRDFHLFVETVGDDVGRMDATFSVVPGFAG